MARVTVEDCVEKLPNRFELVMLAAQRARRIGSGAGLTIDRDNDKNPVIALREIAGATVSLDDLKEELTRSHQRVMAYEEEDDSIDLMDGEEEWGTMAAGARGEGMYADDDMDDEDADSDEEEGEGEPSLSDLAGSAD